MGDIPDWLAQLAAESEEAPDELKRDVDEPEIGDAMPDMSASLEDILGFEAAPEADPEAETAIFSMDDDEPDPLDFLGEESEASESWESSSLFDSEPLIFDDDEEAEDEVDQEEIVYDDLRTQADAALPADLAEKEPGILDKLDVSLANTGLKAWQRLVLAVLLFLDIGIIGLIILVVLGVVQI